MPTTSPAASRSPELSTTTRSEAYEAETREVIVETMERLELDPLAMPGALVVSHGPFTWGADPAEAVANAVALETIAAMASRTLALASDAEPISGALADRHFRRKHGPDAYYGQPAPRRVR